MKIKYKNTFVIGFQSYCICFNSFNNNKDLYNLYIAFTFSIFLLKQNIKYQLFEHPFKIYIQ